MLYKTRGIKHELPYGDGENFFNFEQLNIIALFQRRWSELAVYMRSYINTSIENSPRAEIAAKRLMNISHDFREAMLVFYGPQLADRFTDLFTAFIAKPINVI